LLDAMMSDEESKAKSARARRRALRKLLVGVVTLIFVSVVLTWVMIALMSEAPPELSLPSTQDRATASELTA